MPSPLLPPDTTLADPRNAPGIKSVNAVSSPQKVKSSTQEKQQPTAQKHWNPTRVLNRVASSSSDAENEWEDCDEDEDEDEEEEEKEEDDQRVPDAAVPVLSGVPPSTEQKESKAQERTPSKPVTLLLGDCLFCRTAQHKTPDVASTCNATAEGGPIAKPQESTCVPSSASFQSRPERAEVELQMRGRFRTVRALLSHMERAHMFLVPERDLCSNLPALLDFLRVFLVLPVTFHELSVIAIRFIPHVCRFVMICY